MPAANYFYLTTTLPYVNAEPHIGFAMEIVAADVICRYQRLMGKEVIFNTGTDEHGQKIYQNALAAGQTPQAYVDKYAARFQQLQLLLNLSYDRFIRTTDATHQQAAQEFWRRCAQRGDIYQQFYQVKYCVGCELEKTDSDLIDGRCPLHPNQELEVREEENYFFAFSKYQQPLLDFYSAHPDFVQPQTKMRELVSFVSGGLQDFSISRLTTKMPWGVMVPGDPDHVMYVWFDALINYISTLGWPEDITTFTNYWPGVQIAGKDNLRQQAAMWQAMLLSAQLPNSQKILINGFISVDGQKMSKSLGNVISPAELVTQFGVDGARFLLINLGPIGEDIDVTRSRFEQDYTAHLTNGLGNLCSRVAKLASQVNLPGQKPTDQLADDWQKMMAEYQLQPALHWLIAQINQTDHWLSQTQPWLKSGSEQKELLTEAVSKIVSLVDHLRPFLPDTAHRLLHHFGQPIIQPLSPLFPRL